METNPIRFADGTSGSEDDDYDEGIMYSRDPLAAGLLSEGSSNAEDIQEKESMHGFHGARTSNDTEAATGNNIA